MRKQSTFLVRIVILMTITATQVDSQNIRGRVVDTDSLPIAFAAVRLRSGALVSQTDHLGMFRFSTTDAQPFRRSALTGMESRLRNGILTLHSNGRPAAVELYDIQGRLLLRKAIGDVVGPVSIDLRSSGSSVRVQGSLVLRITQDSKVNSLRVISTGKALVAASERSQLFSSKQLASVATSDPDSITIEKNGYQTKRMAMPTRADSSLTIVLSPSHAEYKAQVLGLQAAFTSSRQSIELTWTPIETDPRPSFYRVYRCTGLTPGAQPSKGAMVSFPNGYLVQDTSRTFQDGIGLERVSCYAIRPYLVINGDTTAGLLSNYACVTNGTVAFAINRGHAFTAIPQCSLMLDDPHDSIKSVRFTHSTLTHVVKASGERKLIREGILPPNDSILALIAEGWFTGQGRLGTNVTVTTVPNFDAEDSENLIRQNALGTRRIFPWTLKKGNGNKTVYAEVTYLDGRIDTLIDIISIQPYTVDVSLLEGNDGRVKVSRTFPAVTTMYVHRPWIDFLVNIGNDTTFSDTFHFWILMSHAEPTVRYLGRTNLDQSWIETVPRGGSLSASQRIYRYSVDTTTAEGGESISRLLRTQPNPATNDMAKLMGRAFSFDRSIPGSLCGKNPVSFSSGKFMSIQEELLNNNQSGWDAISKLTRSFAGAGTKEFVVVALFKGKYFEDTRVVAATGELRGSGQPKSYFDWYIPRINIFPSHPDFRNNGDTIRSTFGYNLDSSGSVIDRGLARITHVELVVARKPASLQWSLNFDIPDQLGSITADTLSLHYLYSLPHTTYPWPGPYSDHILYNVTWSGINTQGWTPGQYIAGIVVQDEYGNRGFGAMNPPTTSTPWTNPWMMTVIP